MLTWTCAVRCGADFICKKMAKQIMKFCIYLLLCGALNPFCLFSLFYFPRWSTIEPKLLRSVVLSRENKSSFLPKSSVLLKYLCYFIICGMCDGKGWTQVSAHRSANTNKSLLNIPVVLSRQLTHCPITGCKILDTRYWLLGSAVRPWRPSLSPICSNIKSVSLLKIYNE